MDRWETHRGDEWWFTSFWCEAEGAFGANSFSILKIEGKGGALSERHFHELLWLTYQQFKEAKVICDLNNQTKPLIESLAQKGLIDWELLQNPYDQDAILKRVEPI